MDTVAALQGQATAASAMEDFLGHLTDDAVCAWIGAMPPGYRRADTADCEPEAPLSRARFVPPHATGLPPHLVTLLGLLLDAANAADEAGRRVLVPLWAEEKMHRAHAMLRLLGTQAGRGRGCARDGFIAAVERALARSLAAAYRTLATPREDVIVPCSAPMRDVVLNLGALFGSHGSNIVIRTAIERLSLPGYKRRALVLCASELVLNALTHAFRDGTSGRITVALRRLDGQRASLLVADNGIGFRSGCPDTTFGVAGSLAGLLEADLVYFRSSAWTTAAEVVFPVASR